MTEVEQALREVSDTLLADLGRLWELEETKRSVAPDDPRLVGLAAQVEEIAKRVLGSSRDQREIAETASALVGTDDPDAPTRSIDETPRRLQVILADWRAAERALLDPTDVLDTGLLAARAGSLRAEYQHAFSQPTRDREG